MDRQDLHLLITAAKIIIYGTFESASRPGLVNNDLLYVVRRRRAALSWLRKRRECIWSKYHDIFNLHNTQHCRLWRLVYSSDVQILLHLSRTEFRSDLYHKRTAPELHQRVQFRYSVQMRSESQQAFRDKFFFPALQLSALLSSRRLSPVSACTLANIDSTKAETTRGSKEACIVCKAKPE